MLTPEYLQAISLGAEEISAELHKYITGRIIDGIMTRMGRGEGFVISSSDKWRIEVLQEAGYILGDIEKEIQKYTKKQESEIKKAMEDAGVTALDYDDQVYINAGLSPTPLKQSPAFIRLMQRNYEATMGEWKNFTRTTAVEAQRSFIKEIDLAYNKVVTGTESYTKAVMDAVNAIASQGVTITYPSGRKMTIEAYTAMVVRTGAAQAAAEVTLARMAEMSYNLVLVSSHFGARPTHEVWQGGKYSVNWDTMLRIKPELRDFLKEKPEVNREYPDFIEVCGYGQVDGICGANCRHHFSVWVEGMNDPYEQFDSEENRKQYEKEQKQRLMERTIRKTKRQISDYEKALAGCKDDKLGLELTGKLSKKKDLLKKQNKSYKDYCKNNNLREQRDRLMIAG